MNDLLWLIPWIEKAGLSLTRNSPPDLRQYPEQILVVCYYLYSFERVISGTHWNDMPEKRKQALLAEE